MRRDSIITPPTRQNDASHRLVMRQASLADRPIVEAMTLSDEQREFAGSATVVFDQLANSRCSRWEHPFVIERDGMPIGFLIIRENGALPDWAPDDTATLHSVRVDAARQRQGVGRYAVEAATVWLARHRPALKQLMLAVNARNLGALVAYRSYGFENTGRVHIGPLGRQIILTRRL